MSDVCGRWSSGGAVSENTLIASTVEKEDEPTGQEGGPVHLDKGGGHKFRRYRHARADGSHE